MKTTITHAAIILADIPFNPDNKHACFGKHFYVCVANSLACKHSPCVQAIPLSSNTRRRLPVQIEIQAECLSRRSYALADQLTLLPREVLEKGKLIGTMDETSMEKIQRAIKLQLALD